MCFLQFSEQRADISTQGLVKKAALSASYALIIVVCYETFIFLEGFNF